jgi:hypothetical protein
MSRVYSAIRGDEEVEAKESEKQVLRFVLVFCIKFDKYFS